MGANLFLNIFFNCGIKSQIPKRLLGDTKCTYKVLASQNKNKNDSGKHRLYDDYLRSSKSCQVCLNWSRDVKFGCQKPTKYGQFMFYKAVKVEMVNSKETSFNNTISSTLSLITVFFEDLFEAINIHKESCGEKEDPKLSITSLNKTNTCDRYDFNIDIINDDEYNALQKELLMLFEAYCIFGFWEFFRNLFYILMEVNKTMSERKKTKLSVCLCVCVCVCLCK
jgi:hypothetical protein